MAPRSQTLPEAKTESAKAARSAFFCELCQKGYSRMPDFEAHEGSYDHQHRKRLKEMRQMSKDPTAASRARAAEAKASEESGGLKSINLSLSGVPNSAPGKKKPVFKSTLQPQNAATLGQTQAQAPPQPQPGESEARRESGVQGAGGQTEDDVDLDPEDGSSAKAEGWSKDRYRPQFPTGCSDPNCHMCEKGFLDWEKFQPPEDGFRPKVEEERVPIVLGIPPEVYDERGEVDYRKWKRQFIESMQAA